MKKKNFLENVIRCSIFPVVYLAKLVSGIIFLACQGFHDDSMLGSVDVFMETSTLSDVSVQADTGRRGRARGQLPQRVTRRGGRGRSNITVQGALGLTLDDARRVQDLQTRLIADEQVTV